MALSLDDLKKRLAKPVVPEATTIIPEIATEAKQSSAFSNKPVPNTAVQSLTIPEQSVKAPSKLGFELQEKVTSLQAALLDRHPRMPVLLREIHTVLRAQPENVTLMSEEEMAIIVDGLKNQTGTELATSMTKGTGAKTTAGKIKQLGLGAF